jgi:linear primary-alkylsulfatase
MDPDLSDGADFDDVERGFVGRLADPVITAADGHVVWDCSKYDFIAGDAPATANPSLWRQGKLAAKHGLFKVTDGVYQVRGLDLSNMSLVQTDSGVIVIDPLMSNESAAAALALWLRCGYLHGARSAIIRERFGACASCRSGVSKPVGSALLSL